jgi:hypothetical protein
VDRSIARRVLATGGALGVIADLVLDGPAYGINVALLVAASLGAGWMLRRPGRAPDSLDTWLPVTALVLAAFVAVRGDPMIATLDALGALVFLGASIVAMSGLAVTRRSASAIAAMCAWTLEATVVGAPRAAGTYRRAKVDRSRGVPDRLLPFARGFMLALPIALILVVLFASADPIFGAGVADLLGWQIDLGALPGRMLFALACAWLAAGLLSVAAVGIPPPERSSLGAASRTGPTTSAWVLGTTEALVVLAIIDLIVALFVGLQIAYLFGGLDTLIAAGLTYSDYARRGFFELVAAACLTGAVVVALETSVVRRTRPYLAGLLGLLALTAIVLVSAAVRLRLYQDAYGWTELRLYVFVTIGALAAALAIMTVLALAGRMRWLGHGLVVIGLVALVGLSAVAPAAFVAERNVERVIDPSLVPADGHAGLDAPYLRVLPDDAIPVLVDALPNLPGPERRQVGLFLAIRKAELATDPAFASPAAWNLGRERAREALTTLP